MRERASGKGSSSICTGSHGRILTTLLSKPDGIQVGAAEQCKPRTTMIEQMLATWVAACVVDNKVRPCSSERVGVCRLHLHQLARTIYRPSIRLGRILETAKSVIRCLPLMCIASFSPASFPFPTRCSVRSFGEQLAMLEARRRATSTEHGA